jgi:hypothetical protein
MFRWSLWTSFTLLPLLSWAIVAEQAAFSGEGGQEGGWRPQVRAHSLPKPEAPRAGGGSLQIPKTAVRKWLLRQRPGLIQSPSESGESQ